MFSDEEDKTTEPVIEIESDEDDVVWIPEKSSSVDNDLEIISSNIPSKRQKLLFPKPKERMLNSRFSLPLFERLQIDSLNIVQWDREDNISLPQDVFSNKSMSEMTAQPQHSESASPIVLSALQQKQKNVIEVPEPEFVVVGDQYDPLDFNDDSDVEDTTLSGCSRTDPVSQFIWGRNPKFLPINQTHRINIINSPPTSLGSSVNKSAPTTRAVIAPNGQISILNSKPSTSTNTDTSANKLALGAPPLKMFKSVLPLEQSSELNLKSSTSTNADISAKSKVQLVGAHQSALKKMLECKSMVPIGKVNFVNEIKGKPVLVKLPSTAMSSTATSSGVSLLKNSALRPVSYRGPVIATEKMDNTVTLHHPSQEISETRTVQFAPMKSVSIESSTYTSGPKMHIPKTSGRLKVILPKRS